MAPIGEYRTIPTQPASGAYAYMFTMQNFPAPAHVAMRSITVNIGNGVNTVATKVINNPTIVEGKLNTLNVTVP